MRHLLLLFGCILFIFSSCKRNNQANNHNNIQTEEKVDTLSKKEVTLSFFGVDLGKKLTDSEAYKKKHVCLEETEVFYYQKEIKTDFIEQTIWRIDVEVGSARAYVSRGIVYKIEWYFEQENLRQIMETYEQKYGPSNRDYNVWRFKNQQIQLYAIFGRKYSNEIRYTDLLEEINHEYYVKSLPQKYIESKQIDKQKIIDNI